MGNAMNAICRHAARASQINLRHSTPVCSREGPNLDHTSNLSEMASKVSRHFVGGMPDHESNCCCQQRRVRVRLAAGVFKGECTGKMSPSRRRAQGASERDGGFMERFNQSPCGLLACEPAFHSPTRASDIAGAASKERGILGGVSLGRRTGKQALLAMMWTHSGTCCRFEKVDRWCLRGVARAGGMCGEVCSSCYPFPGTSSGGRPECGRWTAGAIGLRLVRDTEQPAYRRR
ncbi:hypothetical protein EV126DRAFT_109605 [Verticillium dahliae]|nr:hypothetical protein EV126DRAFT_109605 [Verticillium dahliae]